MARAPGEGMPKVKMPLVASEGKGGASLRRARMGILTMPRRAKAYKPAAI